MRVEREVFEQIDFDAIISLIDVQQSKQKYICFKLSAKPNTFYPE